MSHEAGFDALQRALADIEAACAKGEPERAATLWDMYARALRNAVDAGRLDAVELRTLRATGDRLAEVFSRQRDALALEMARSNRAGRASRAYLEEP